jgi:hypothetical protein
MESKIYLEKIKYWNELVSCNHDMFVHEFYPLDANLEKNKEFHEHLGLQYIADQYETINGKRIILYMFKVINKHQYLLSKIKYAF